jgi:hypothetical protein
LKQKKPTLEELVARYKPETLAPAREVMEHIYKAVTATPDFTLAGGTKAQVTAFYDPQLSDDGELSCGFDVVLDNGTHLEFKVTNSGWGKSFAAGVAPKILKPGRER